MDLVDYLQGVMPQKSLEEIKMVNDIVEEMCPYDTLEEKIDKMYDMLRGDAGDSAPMQYLIEAMPQISLKEIEEVNKLVQETCPDDTPEEKMDKIFDMLKGDLRKAEEDFVVIMNNYKKELYGKIKAEVAKMNRLKTCGVCFEEILPEDCAECRRGCVYCKACIQKHIEVRMGENDHPFVCWICFAEFNLNLFEYLLPKRTFERLLMKIRSEELKELNPNELETCPFCDFAEITPRESRIFYCKNPECQEESCRKEEKDFVIIMNNYKKELYDKIKAEVAKLNRLKTCGVCFEEFLPEDCAECRKGCVYCKACIKKYIEIRMGENNHTFVCWNCFAEFNFTLIEYLLPKRTFQRLLMKIRSEELKKLNPNELETCPFCDFAEITSRESRIFYCKNPECQKESCRLCHKESHIPLRCHELQQDVDVERRIYMENKMTEALVRICYRCKKEFVKSEGCNMMVCRCGAKMCYLCSEPIQNYDHFGENKPCQSFTNDQLVDLHRVQWGVQKARRVLGHIKIKNDPAEGFN